MLTVINTDMNIYCSMFRIELSRKSTFLFVHNVLVVFSLRSIGEMNIEYRRSHESSILISIYCTLSLLISIICEKLIWGAFGIFIFISSTQIELNAMVTVMIDQSFVCEYICVCSCFLQNKTLECMCMRCTNSSYLNKFLRTLVCVCAVIALH